MTSAPKKAIVFASIFIMIFSSIAIAAPADADGTDDVISVTDGVGTTHTFSSIPEHVVTIGLGTTETLIKIGVVEKIVVSDKYSYLYGGDYPSFGRFIEKCDNNDILHSGSLYGDTGMNDILNDIAAQEGKGKFNYKDDVIFITNTTSTEKIYNKLTDAGCKHVLRWEKSPSYKDVIDFAKAVSKVTTGKIQDIVEQMSYVVEKIDAKFKKEGWANKKTFYVTYSGGAFKVGNVGSLATGVLLASHTDVITIDRERSETTYETNLTKLIEDYGKDVVIFADRTTIVNETEILIDLVKLVGTEVYIYPMERLWNNWSIDSTSGIWSIACTMYHDYDPDFFSGEIPSPVKVEEENMLLFATLGIIVSIAVAAVTLRLARE